jgi:beta-glucosidase/6-phospho-beta-glucosidase/beta-galactosidase
LRNRLAATRKADLALAADPSDQIREALELVLGKDKADYYWDRFETYFFGEEDAKFFASLGLNCMRLPFNYRHVMDDSNPDVFKKDGLKQLDRVIDLCAKHGIYSVIDLHALPGGQNPDWHCDAGSAQNNCTLFFLVFPLGRTASTVSL